MPPYTLVLGAVGDFGVVMDALTPSYLDAAPIDAKAQGGTKL